MLVAPQVHWRKNAESLGDRTMIDHATVSRCENTRFVHLFRYMFFRFCTRRKASITDRFQVDPMEICEQRTENRFTTFSFPTPQQFGSDRSKPAVPLNGRTTSSIRPTDGFGPTVRLHRRARHANAIRHLRATADSATSFALR